MWSNDVRLTKCNTRKGPVLHIVGAQLVLHFFPLKSEIKNEKLKLKQNIHFQCD